MKYLLSAPEMCDTIKSTSVAEDSKSSHILLFDVVALNPCREGENVRWKRKQAIANATACLCILICCGSDEPS